MLFHFFLSFNSISLYIYGEIDSVRKFQGRFVDSRLQTLSIRPRFSLAGFRVRSQKSKQNRRNSNRLGEDPPSEFFQEDFRTI
jgi:hypothetical protein